MIVVWRITERCNLSCRFCAYDQTLPGPRRDVEAQTIERFCTVLAEYRRTSQERILLSWLGGEPLLWQPVYDVSRRLRQSFNVDISATTNGTTLHLERVQKHILDTFAELTVSVDGFAEFHDEVRGWRQGWQQLRTSVQALAAQRSASDSKLTLRANVVLMRDNVRRFPALCAELATWGFNEITFNQLGGRDRPAFFMEHRLQPDDAQFLATTLLSLRGQLAVHGVRLCGSDAYLGRIEASTRDVPLAINDCAPGESMVFIDERGRIAPCSFTGDVYGVPIESLATIHDLASLHSKFREAQRCTPAPACGDCPSTHVFSKFAV